MKKGTGIFVILISILALGIGYAAISSVDLNINGSTATVTPDDDNFDVIFKAESTFSKTSGVGTVTFTRTDDHNVTFTLTGFTKRGDTATITIPFTNDSETLKAELADALITNSNDEYFTVSATSLAGTVLEEKGQTGSDSSLVLTVTAVKTPVSDEESTTITAKITASPRN